MKRYVLANDPLAKAVHAIQAMTVRQELERHSYGRLQQLVRSNSGKAEATSRKNGSGASNSGPGSRGGLPVVSLLLAIFFFLSGCAARRLTVAVPGCPEAKIDVPRGCTWEPMNGAVVVDCPDSHVTYRCKKP